MAEILVLRLGPEAVDAARDLVLTTFTELSGPATVERWYSDVRNIGESYVGSSGQAAFVASSGGLVVGTAFVRHRCPTIEPIACRYDPASTCELGRVTVRPEFRRQGIARDLVEAARSWASERYSLMSLHCDGANEPALAFWRSLAHEIHTDHGTNSVYFEMPLRTLPTRRRVPKTKGA